MGSLRLTVQGCHKTMLADAQPETLRLRVVWSEDVVSVILGSARSGKKSGLTFRLLMQRGVWGVQLASSCPWSPWTDLGSTFGGGRRQRKAGEGFERAQQS